MGGQVEVIEVKDSVKDFRRDLEHPEKSAPFAPFASRRCFAVAPPSACR